MNSNHENTSDEELLRRYLVDPNSRLGRESKEVLEYRKYREAKKQNAKLIALTIYMTAAIVAQVVLAAMQFAICIRNQ